MGALFRRVTITDAATKALLVFIAFGVWALIAVVMLQQQPDYSYEISAVGDKLEDLGSRMGDLEERLSSVDSTVDAIETTLITR
jgi:hypothetical protein